jgi:hypothetical protein
VNFQACGVITQYQLPFFAGLSDKSLEKNETYTHIYTYTVTMNYIYGSRLWNFIRRSVYRTPSVDAIIEIDEDCFRKEDSVFCFHNVKYMYNGLEQEEELSSQQILYLAKDLGYRLSSHFSTNQYMKELIAEETPSAFMSTEQLLR